MAMKPNNSMERTRSVQRNDTHQIRAFVEKTAKSFLKPREFSIPAFISLVCGVAVGLAVLGNLGIASIWPLRFSSLLQWNLAREASFGINWGSYVQTSNALQAQGLNQFYVVFAGMALAAILVAGLNLAILLQARSTSRSHEQAVRVALGASSRQLIIERLAGAGALFGAATLIGLVFGYLGKVGLAASWPHESLTSALLVRLSIALPVITVLLLLVGLLSLRSHSHSLNAGGAGRFLTGGNRLVGRQYPEGLWILLPSLQIGMSITLLMGSSLLLQGTFSEATVEDPDSRGSALFRLPVEAHHASAQARSRDVGWGGLLSELKGVPGVKEAALVSPGAWVGVGTSDHIWTECGACVIGGMWVPFKAPLIQHHIVSPDSFRAMGLSVTSGREFTQGDGPDAPLVAIVNETYAREHFDMEGPVGKTLSLGRGQKSWHTVVGIVEDFGISGIGSTKAPKAAVFLSAYQHPPDVADIFLAFDRGSRNAAEQVLSTVERNGAFSASGEPIRIGDYLADAVAPFSWFSKVSFALGLLTLGISAFGLFAILDYSVSLRAGEIGVRRALGAGRTDVIRLVFGRSTKIFFLGAFLGLEGALLLTAWIEEIAFEGQVFDLPLFFGITGVFALAAFFGTLRPTRHATRIPPRVAMGGM